MNKDEIILKEGELLEDLQINDFWIIQNHNYYCFAEDSVLLANFVKAKKTDTIVELCSGSGIISLLVLAKNTPKEIIGFEIDPYLCDMANRSAQVCFAKNIKFINTDLINAPQFANKVNIVICNPPYYLPPQDLSKISEKNLKAKYEITTNLFDILKTASLLLNNKGKLYFVYPTDRLQELFTKASSVNLICKNMTLIEKKNKSLALFEFVKGANIGINIQVKK